MSEINDPTEIVQPFEPHQSKNFFDQPITVDQILYLMANHQKTNPGDTESGWISYEEVKKFMHDNPGSDGIRLYFGRYDYEMEDECLRGKITAVFVPTQNMEPGTPPTSENSKDMAKKGQPLPGGPNPSYYALGDDRIPLCPPKCSKYPSDLTQNIECAK